MANQLWIGSMIVGPVQTNCYILRNKEFGSEAVVIDPGGDAKKLIAAIKKVEAVPYAILLTHAHYDHIMAVRELQEEFPDCRVYIGEAERPMVEDPELNCSAVMNENYTISPDEYLSDGAEIPLLGSTVRVIASPGHTAGSVCYYIESESVLFSGDTIFRDGVGRTDLPTGNTGKLYKSLEMLLTTLPEETEVLPGHGPATTVGREKAVEGFDS